MSRAADQAYSIIRQAIVSGELPPGAQLTEEMLAERCRVSRTPIREALRRLEADFFVRRSDSLRTFVAEWSDDDIGELFSLRAMLEGHAAARAALRASAETRRGLWQAVDLIDVAIGRERTPDVAVFLEQNRRFHRLILQAAGSERLTEILQRLVEQPVVLRTAQAYSRDDLESSNREHHELARAIDLKDADWARSAMAAHIRRALHAFINASRRLRDLAAE